MDFSITLYQRNKKKESDIMEDFKRAALYIRVSTDDQTEYSPDSQIKLCKKYAYDHNMDILQEHIYQEDGLSGTNADKRIKFQKMIANAKQKPKPFDVILVYSFSRFARNREDSTFYKSMLRKKLGIEVISITQPLSDGKDSIIMEAIYEAMDEYYSVDLAENSLRGKIEKASRGEHMGKAPIGYIYDKNTKTIYIDEQHSQTIQFIFNEWIKPETTVCGLASKLNRLGIKTKKGYAWSEQTLKIALRNPLYAGYTRFTLGGMYRGVSTENTKIVKGKHNPIISEELWQKALAKWVEHDKTWFGYRKPYTKQEYWLKGILKCSACGKNLVRVQRSSRNVPYYQCCGYNKRMCSISHQISENKIMDVILQELKNTFTDRLEIKIDNTIQEVDNSKLLESSISRLNARLERIKLAFEDGIDSLDEYKQKKTKILEEIEVLKKDFEYSKSKEQQDIKKQEIYNLCEKAYELLSNENVDIKIKEVLANELFSSIVYDKAHNTIIISYVHT